ncbi:MAG: phosphoribosylformylglycinamidine cyclo-ligase [Calditrichaeota bacterium]|nr:MAG: phosphoribosylformylglycinamidine cyclo-ligase [Calditrichota bacterium]
MSEGFTYKKAGVDIESAEAVLRRVKGSIRSTHGPSVLSDIGLFSGFFQLPVQGMECPVLVASTDGVGTKLKVALLAGVHKTVGQDLVHHCINDIATSGAEPLFFLDYFACGHLNSGVFEQVVEGLVTACRNTGVALLGGETAEMPDLYAADDYDLCGTIVGIVDKKDILDGSAIRPGDVLVGVASSGLHTNGYSLARKVLLAHYRLDQYMPELSTTLAEALLEVHRNYLPLIRNIRQYSVLHGIAHITGGGIEKNTRRLIGKGLDLLILWGSWEIPPLFRLIQTLGQVPETDMRQTFNLGVGLVMAVSAEQVDVILQQCKDSGYQAFPIGRVIEADQK